MNILELKTSKDVECYFEELAGSKEKTIAIDIECEMNLHCYGEHLCLIQIYDQKNKILIDPLKFEKREKLNTEFTNKLKMAYEENLIEIKIKAIKNEIALLKNNLEKNQIKNDPNEILDIMQKIMDLKKKEKEIIKG